MTKHELYCNYLIARKKASDLDKIANQIRKLAENKFNSELNKIEKNWVGTVSIAYINKGKILTEHLIQKSISLQNTAETIRKVAERVYNTEMKALEIAKSRTYK